MIQVRRNDMTPMSEPYKKYEVTVPLAIFIFGLAVSLLLYFFLVMLPTQADKVIINEPGQYELSISNAGNYNLRYEDPSALFGWFSQTDRQGQRLLAQIDHAMTGELLYTSPSASAEVGRQASSSLATFNVEEAGIYTLTVDAAEQDLSGLQIVVTPDVSSALSVVYTVLIITLLLTALAFAVTLLLKKWKSSRTLAV